MASSLAKWEADPFFPAAEEVQNSADRMESAFRSWKHVKGLGRLSGGASISAYKRELITALDTVKWQLQEFERAIEVGIRRKQQHRDKDAPARHALFIGAIRSQVCHAEKALADAAEQNDSTATCIHSKSEDEDSLAKFLSGSSSDVEDVPWDNHHLSGIMQSKHIYSIVDSDTQDRRRDSLIPLSESTPGTAGPKSPAECCLDREVICNFAHWHEYGDEEAQFASKPCESVPKQSSDCLENFSDAVVGCKTSLPGCTPNMWMSAGVSLESLKVGCTDLLKVSEGRKGAGCSRFLNRDLNDGKDAQRNMENSKGLWFFPFFQMFKSILESDIEQGTRISSANCHKLLNCFVASEFYTNQKKRTAAFGKAVQLHSWMRQQIPLGRILQILSALLILISFVGISMI